MKDRVMKKITFYVRYYYKNNSIFDLEDKFLNLNNVLYPFYQIKKQLADKGYDLSTQDINPISESEIVIYNEIPRPYKVDKSKKNILLLFECVVIRPDNWHLKLHEDFDVIFTWDDNLVDNKKYFKFNFPNCDPKINYINFSDKKYLSAMIASNKSASHSLELYSERRKIIKWFEGKKDVFQLYGVGWDRVDYSNTNILKVLNKLKILQFIKVKAPANYMGKASNKVELFKDYKFSLCLENAKSIDGYITEKIFDSFFAGCVPIYLGPDNILDHIPQNCFVPYKDFSSFDELLNFMQNISKESYQQYQNNIRDFLNGPKYKQFSSENFVETMVAIV